MIDQALIERLSKPTPHLVIGGQLDGQWIEDSITPASELDGAASKRIGNECWRVVRFRLGRAIDRHVWISTDMTEAKAFDHLLAVYGKGKL